MTRSNQNGLSRRRLLQGASALGGAALILPAGVRRASAEPMKGGVMRFAIAAGSTSDGYDPGLWDQQFVQVFATARHNYLTEIASDGQLVGELAEEWASDDAVTWRFKLRSGVTFHSGKPVTVEDVIASLNHHRGEDSTSAAKPIVESITDLTKDGDWLVVTLSAANADFPFIVSDYHLAIMPAVDGKIDVTSPDGCGPYVVDSYEPGVSATLSRNPNYWKTDRAHLDGIELITIIDPAARQNALLTGEVDVIDPVDKATVGLMQRAGNVRIISVAGTQHYVFPMDSRAAPFSDNNVRMALKFGLDRQELVDKILNGYGALGNDHPISTSNRFHNSDLPQREYDADQAKFYLKKAGLETLDVTLSAADAAFTGAVDAAVLYAEKAAAAGININVDRAPNDGYWDNVWMKKPFCASYWGGRPTEDWMFTTAYTTGVPWNETFWSNARFDELLLAARSELDEAKRREMYFEMQKIVSDEGATVIPMFASYVMATNDRVGTPDQIAANWTLDGFRAPERWWLTA
ncbi:ABC transporter substrate-binding protein [Frigidibacter sp. ROC022]|uniref:ABC transporter substrate-binding protein n=1 Tax=Frigidibacter sp. ROC022 TaxID=2971796 RepID=UPI00215B571D|nr:ABC transporter substrate-binding protein [Frigidibacter sp. ROC022]MCR8722848.1 ABC transporter substrate-binding protein [Frigidibacter sp. ROC022]